MLNNLKITLYDLFGYFLPGIPAALGIVILFWTICRPNGMHISATPPTSIWIAFGVAAYFLGHVVEFIGSVLYGDYWETCRPTYSKLFVRDVAEDSIKESLTQRIVRWIRLFLNSSNWDLNSPRNFSDSLSTFSDLLRKATKQAAEQLGRTPERVPIDWLFQLLSKRPSTDDSEKRALFTYREGFYRGSSLSVLFLALCLLVRIIGQATLLVPDRTIPKFNSVFGVVVCTMPKPDFVFGAIVCLLVTPALAARAYQIRLKRCVDLVTPPDEKVAPGTAAEGEQQDRTGTAKAG
jgi:hypothetical protein